MSQNGFSAFVMPKKEDDDWPPELAPFVTSHERSHARQEQDIRDARESFRELLKQANKIIEDRDKVIEDRDSLSAEVDQLTETKQELTRAKQNLQRRNTRLTTAKAQLEAANEAIAEEKRDTENELKDANTSNRILNTRITGLNTQIDGLNTQITELTEDKRRSYMAFAIALAVTYVEWVVIVIGYLQPEGSIAVIAVLTVIYLVIVTKYFGKSWLLKLWKSSVEP